MPGRCAGGNERFRLGDGSAFASSEAGALAVLFCATYPAMVEHLVLYAGMARFTAAPIYPFRPAFKQLLQAVAHSWGKPIAARDFAPSRAEDPEFCEVVARFQRQTASPAAIRRLMAVNDQIDRAGSAAAPPARPDCCTTEFAGLFGIALVRPAIQPARTPHDATLLLQPNRARRGRP